MFERVLLEHTLEPGDHVLDPGPPTQSLARVKSEGGRTRVEAAPQGVLDTGDPGAEVSEGIDVEADKDLRDFALVKRFLVINGLDRCGCDVRTFADPQSPLRHKEIATTGPTRNNN